MKVKFIDSKNRTRTIFLDEQNFKTYQKDMIKYYEDFFGPIFKEKISDFLATRPQKEIEKVKTLILRMSEISKEEKITDDKLISADTNLQNRYIEWLDENYPDNPDRLISVVLKWNNDLNRKFDNKGKTDLSKHATYSNTIKALVTKHNLDDGDFESSGKGEERIILLGKRKDIDGLKADLVNVWNTSIKVPETGGKNRKGENTKADIEKLKEEIEDYKFDIETFKKELETETDENEREFLLNSIKEYEQDIKNTEEEINLIMNPSNYTIEDIEKECFEDEELEDVPDYYDTLDITTMDSKDWYNAENVKFLYGFENSNLIRDGKKYNYFDVTKKLQKKYLDSKESISYDMWLSKNPQIITDTLNKIDEGDKKMNDSLKDLKFKFKNTGIEITVLDSEGKSFDEVKKEAIEVHRQMVSQQIKDSKEDSDKTTEEVVEELGAKATNDSVIMFLQIFSKSAKEAKEKGMTKEEWLNENLKGSEDNENVREYFENIWDNVNGLTEDSKADDVKIKDEVEETEEDKYRVIVNGKKIGTFDTLEEAEEAEKKALEAIEKGIPKVELEDDIINEFEDETEQKAYENAMECIKYGVGKSDCDFYDIPEERANEIWNHALKHVANEI